MTARQNAFVHNKFDVTVKDAMTGEIKQEAVGYNVITDMYFTVMLNSSARSPLYYIAFGSGTGTPSASDTNLFARIDSLRPTTLETVYAYPTSHITKQIVLNADQYNGRTITEVGFDSSYTPRGSGRSTTALVTHALLQDSEGHQIAIQKTNTDVVYITATFYCTYTSGGFGNNGIYPSAAENDLIKWIFGEFSETLYLRTYHRNLTRSDELNNRYMYSKSSSFSSKTTCDVSARTLTITDFSILSEEGGTNCIRCIGFPGIGAFNFPDSSVMTGYPVTAKTIGTGDGSTKDFNMGVPVIKGNSVQIFVNDTEMTEGTDYTVDYDGSNSTDNYCEYYSAGLSLKYTPNQVKFGNSDSQSLSNTYRDPFLFVSHNCLTLAPYSADITQATPIWMDFLTAKTCNTLKFSMISLSNTELNTLVIEYSDDNENWNTVTWTRDGTVYKWTDTSARYWRIYVSNYTWNQRLENSQDYRNLDGTSTAAKVFLGRAATSLHFTNPPAADSIITANYQLDVPYKTENNLIRISVVITLGRG